MNSLIKALVVCMALTTLFNSSAYPAADKQSEVTLGVSIIPSANWSVSDVMTDNKDMTYRWEATNFTSYEGSFKFKKYIFGVNFEVEDNFIGKAEKYMGYLGYDNMHLRYQSGRLKGAVDWKGQLGTGMSSSFDFDSKFTHVDLIRWLEKGSAIGYIGASYTSFDAPVEVSTLITNTDQAHQKFGIPVYDKKYEVRAYSFIFGLDTMGDAIRGQYLGGGEGFGFMAVGQDRIGFGNGKISEDVVVAAESLNPGRKFTERNSFIGFLENDTTFGMQYTKTYGKATLCAGLGYNIMFVFVVPFSGAAKNPADLGYDTSFDLFRHGPVFRLYALW